MRDDLRRSSKDYVPEPYEKKEEIREQLRRAVEEFKRGGGEIKVYGISGTETISRAEIKDEYGVTDELIDKWVEQTKFPVMVAKGTNSRNKRKRAERANDTYYVRDIERFFKKRLYEIKDYSTSFHFDQSYKFNRDR